MKVKSKAGQVADMVEGLSLCERIQLHVDVDSRQTDVKLFL